MMKIVLLLVTFVLVGCSGLTPTNNKTSAPTVYGVAVTGNNQTNMKLLYNSVINTANKLCKNKKQKYIQIISLTDESGAGYDPLRLSVVHFKRPSLHLSFSCIDIKKARVVLVK